MATDASYVDYVLGQLSSSGEVTLRRMFGEYALYLGGKTVALVCDNQCFLKRTPGSIAMLGDAATGSPYPGAKPHYVIDEQLEDRDLAIALLRAVAGDLPLPKAKKKPGIAPSS